MISRRAMVVGGALAVQGSAAGLGEGAATGGTSVAAVGAALDVDVALSDPPPCGAVEVVAELGLRVHRQRSPGAVWRPR